MLPGILSTCRHPTTVAKSGLSPALPYKLCCYSLVKLTNLLILQAVQKVRKKVKCTIAKPKNWSNAAKLKCLQDTYACLMRKRGTQLNDDKELRSIKVHSVQTFLEIFAESIGPLHKELSILKFLSSLCMPCFPPKLCSTSTESTGSPLSVRAIHTDCLIQ